MSTRHGFPAEQAHDMDTKILVWDLPTRIAHWLLAASFAGAFLTADSEYWRQLHVMLGYTVAVVVGFRLAWGVVGSRHARFSDFACGPGQVLSYLRSLLYGKPRHYVGHNPAGSWVIFGLLGLAVLVTLSGHAVYTETDGEALAEAHEGLAQAMLGLVTVHVAGVLASSVVHRENLVRAMIDGMKRGEPGEAIRGPHRLAALLLVLAVGFLWARLI